MCVRHKHILDENLPKYPTCDMYCIIAVKALVQYIVKPQLAKMYIEILHIHKHSLQSFQRSVRNVSVRDVVFDVRLDQVRNKSTPFCFSKETNIGKVVTKRMSDSQETAF